MTILWWSVGIISALSLVMYFNFDKILFEKIPVKHIYGEMIYGSKNKQIIYDLSRLEKDGIVGMQYFTEDSEEQMINDIADRSLEGLEEQFNYHYNPEDRPKALEELKQYKILQAPKLFEIENAVLLQNRITKRYVVEGDIKLWTQ